MPALKIRVGTTPRHSNLRKVCTKVDKLGTPKQWCITRHVLETLHVLYSSPSGFPKQANACRSAGIFQPARTVHSHGTYLDQYLVISSSSQPLQAVSHVLTAAGYSDPHNGGKVEAVFQKPKRMPPHRQAEGTVIHLWSADVSISLHYACLAEASCPSPFGPGDGR